MLLGWSGAAAQARPSLKFSVTEGVISELNSPPVVSTDTAKIVVRGALAMGATCRTLRGKVHQNHSDTLELILERYRIEDTCEYDLTPIRYEAILSPVVRGKT